MAQRQGVHCIVATPGRLNDHLNKKRLNMDICKYFVLDEGDRMLDLGFDEEVSYRGFVAKYLCFCPPFAPYSKRISISLKTFFHLHTDRFIL